MVSDEHTAILIEVGIKFSAIQKALNYKTASIDGALISHEHRDHSKSVATAMKYGIDCYMSNGTRNALQIGSHRLHIIKDRREVRIGTMSVFPFNVAHDASEPMGFWIFSGKDRVVYLTDTKYSKPRFPATTHYMIECNYALDILRENTHNGEIAMSHKNRVMNSHMSLDTVKQLFRENDLSKLQEVWLLHLSDGNSDEERFKREIQEIVGVPVYIA